MSEELMKYLKVYQKGDVLIQEGEHSNNFFCLVQGKLSVWKGCKEEGNQQIHLGDIEEKGSYFGEMSYFLEEPRTATIRAEMTTKVLDFPGEMLPKLIAQQGGLAVKLCKALAERLKHSSKMTHEEAVGRINMRTDASDMTLYAKESFQKVFMMLSAIQMQFQNPLLKLAIEYMGKNKLLQGGKTIVLTEEELKSFPLPLVPHIQKLYG